MSGSLGIRSMPSHGRKHGADTRSRLHAFSRSFAAGLLLLASWCLTAWLPAGSALAASYPPALGCAVAGSATAGAGAVTGAVTGVVTVRGMGFRAGSRVQVSVAGRRAGGVIADPAGSFETAWPVGALASGMTVTATGVSCTVTSMLAIENQQPPQGGSLLPPPASSSGPPAGQPVPAQPATPIKPAQPITPAQPAKPAKARPAPGPIMGPVPAPPARVGDPVATAIPSIPLTGLPPQLFLGVAGALLLAGAALTGLTGRLGHRGERRPAVPNPISSTLPPAPGNA